MSADTAAEAHVRFKTKYGVHEKVDLFRFEEIVREIKAESKTTTKRKKGKK